jgi:hypothetical protein
MDLVTPSRGQADAVARYRAASEAGDLSGMLAALAPGVELVSPISGRLVFRGIEDVRTVLQAVLASVTHLSWTHETSGEGRRIVVGEGRVGPFRLTDAMVLELDDEGRIERITPHLRPWLALTLLALRLGRRLVRRPAVLRRAMSAARESVEGAR